MLASDWDGMSFRRPCTCCGLPASMVGSQKYVPSLAARKPTRRLHVDVPPNAMLPKQAPKIASNATTVPLDPMLVLIIVASLLEPHGSLAPGTLARQPGERVLERVGARIVPRGELEGRCHRAICVMTWAATPIPMRVIGRWWRRDGRFTS